MKILVVSNQNNAKTVDALYQLSAYFASQNIEFANIDVTELPDAAFPFSGLEVADACPGAAGAFDMMITLGGDGTIIHSSRLAVRLGVPMLGINFGYLGFLANNADDGLLALVADALAGEALEERRQNLRIEVECVGDDTEPIENPRTFYALNEIAISRGAAGHILGFDFAVSGEQISHMRGDGLVVSTATGSTAYALAAGGPVVGPMHRGMIVVPLAPHTLYSRAIVTEHQDVVEVTFAEDSPSAQEVALFADGDALLFERPIHTVTVHTTDTPVTLLNRRTESFYSHVAHTFFK